MTREITGKVLKYGDSLDTDVMLTGKYLELSTSETEELAKHAMEAIDPDFPKKIKASPIMVGGKNFGCGSSREQSPVALKSAGVALIVAESFGRIFFRNLINIGLPCLISPDISRNVNEGDTLKVNLETGEVKNMTTGVIIRGEKLPDFLLDILDSGGLVPHYEKELIQLSH